MAQDVDGTPLRDLTLETREKFAPRRAVDAQLQGLQDLVLGCHEEAAQLNEIDAVLTVIVARVTEQPAGAAGHRRRGLGCDVRRDEDVRASAHTADDQLLETA